MIDESLRRRLESLNRAPIPALLPTPGEAASPGLSLSKSAAGHAAPPPQIFPVPPAASPRPTAGLLHSGDAIETPLGEHLRIRLPVENLWPNGPQLIASRQEFLHSQLAAAQQAIEPAVAMAPEFATLVRSLPDRTVALDLETCGLAGSALFLIGLLRQIDGQPTIELLLARNYAEEAAVLATLWQTIAGCDVLLTFNGKTFDWPMVLERSIRHRLQPVGWTSPTESVVHTLNVVGSTHPTKLHIDILHHARRRWKKLLPNCRLQTLEQHVCRRRRDSDIPGHRIPAVYADFVRTGFERDMGTVLHHNALDLVTLFDLALRLAA